jgi:transcriptional regulator with XRE-family HTH domain
MKDSYNFEKLIDRARYCAELAGNMAQLSYLSGVSRSQVWRIVTGRADMTTEIAIKLSDAVGVDTGWLVTGRGNPKSGKRSEIIEIQVYDSKEKSVLSYLKKPSFINLLVKLLITAVRFKLWIKRCA